MDLSVTENEDGAIPLLEYRKARRRTSWRMLARLALVAVTVVFALSVTHAQPVNDLVFYEGDGCSQDIVFTYNSRVDADDNCKSGGACKGDNDEARSLRIGKTVRVGTRIILFDSPGGDTDDDFVTIDVLDPDFLRPEGYCLVSFEQTFSNPDINSGIQTDYFRKNGLNGKVSRVRITSVPEGGATGTGRTGVRSAALSAPTGASLIVSSSNLCLDIAGGGAERGAAAVQWPCHGGPNQRWFYRGDAIIVGSSGLCLDVRGGGAERGLPVQQWPCNGGPNQRWNAVPAGNGRVSLRAESSGMCLDIAGGGTERGAPAVQWPCTGGPNQAFTRN